MLGVFFDSQETQTGNMGREKGDIMQQQLPGEELNLWHLDFNHWPSEGHLWGCRTNKPTILLLQM